jgi:hypothetical protein
MRNFEESKIQINAIKWFRYRYPKYICFSVPNGGVRNITNARILKAEGVLAGVSDLIIVAEKKVVFIEIKTRVGRQNDTQKSFQHDVERLGFQYFVCRSFDEFKETVENIIN